LLLLNKSKKRHTGLHLNLSEEFKELAEILKDSYKNFKRTYLFTDYNDSETPISIQGLYKRMINLYSFTGKRVGVNILRASYLTYQSEQKRLSVADKKKLAILMRTRKDKIDDNYIKILPKQDKQEIIDDIKADSTKPKREKINPYQKQLDNNKRYYEKHKDQIIERIKKNQASKPKEEINRKRIIYYLNGDDTYKNKVKPETIEKYNIELVNGIYK